MAYKHRDVDFVKLNEKQYLAIACDSCGAIGLKENDTINVPYHITGKYAARVCLMEILSIGAKPIALTVNICNEPNPVGEELLEGISDELSESGLDIPISVSTEKNMKTSMTALGVSAIGTVFTNKILVNKISSGHYVYTIGIPCVGNEVLENQSLTSDTKTLKKLLNQESVKEIIPVGSSGIKGELDKLCESQGIKVEFSDCLQVDIHKSAGPCTAIIVISNDKLKKDFAIPVNFIGKIV